MLFVSLTSEVVMTSDELKKLLMEHLTLELSINGLGEVSVSLHFDCQQISSATDYLPRDD